MGVEIGGHVEPGFEPVRDAFANNFEAHGEVGAGYALYVDGDKVVDVWGGVADVSTGRAYDDDTLQLVFSTTKGATAACAHVLAQRGDLDIDAPVARYWPEFAQAGKERVPVRWLLCHKVGLPAFDAVLEPGAAFLWDPVVDALAAQAPYWEPGTAHGYHAITYGWLVGEVVRRISGKSLGTFFHDEIATPLGLEFWIGLPEEHEPRVAPLIGGLAEPSEDAESPLASLLGGESLTAKAFNLNGAFGGSSTGANSRIYHAAEIPAANGITNARSLARMYAGLIGTVDGGPAEPLLTRDQVDRARQRQTEGADRIISFPALGVELETPFALGFWSASEMGRFGGVGAFGHPGAGGSVGFADPENKLAGGYVMNRMESGISGDPRSTDLIRASYECADAPCVYA
jgi:CubicO group peptidase (beta-lactamase class C family)